MSNKVASKDFGPEFCKAVGIPVTGIKSITLNVVAGEAVSITIQRCLLDHEAQMIRDLVSRYELTEKPVE